MLASVFIVLMLVVALPQRYNDSVKTSNFSSNDELYFPDPGSRGGQCSCKNFKAKDNSKIGKGNGDNFKCIKDMSN